MAYAGKAAEGTLRLSFIGWRMEKGSAAEEVMRLDKTMLPTVLRRLIEQAIADTGLDLKEAWQFNAYKVGGSVVSRVGTCGEEEAVVVGVRTIMLMLTPLSSPYNICVRPRGWR